MLDRTDIQRFAVATFGALLLSAAFIAGAAAPARAAAPDCGCRVVCLAR